jgi:hypothetical protein
MKLGVGFQLFLGVCSVAAAGPLWGGLVWVAVLMIADEIWGLK